VISTKIGPYEILAKLGEGGMGVVYKARDTRLDRMVAIKILAPHIAGDAELRARFEREARTISQLQHPHICALFDVGQQDGVDFLVMEHIEGESLADRLLRGPLPLEQTLRFGAQIAAALDKAHRQRIIHRDLKPGNVMLTRSGVKLLDFGLAKLQAAPGPSSAKALAETPTEVTSEQPPTQQGTLLGTLQYMAPEQLEARSTDSRTDLWGLGCVLYEMATGLRPFAARSRASLISAIMTGEPSPISQHQPTSPPAFDRLVRCCLEKDPDERWQSAHDVARELRWIGDGGALAVVASDLGTKRSRRELLAWALASVALAVALAAAAVAIRSAHHAAVQPVSAAIMLPEKSAVRAVSLSPDGTSLVVVARDLSGKSLLWLRPLDSLVLQPLPETENPANPFWSPDARYIGFFADGKLKKIAASGGPPQTLCDAPLSRGGAWSRDGVILFAPVADGPLLRTVAAGGVPVPVTRIDPLRGETSHRWPFFLPDGRHFLYYVARFASGAPEEKMGLYVGSLDSREEKFLLHIKSSATYAPSLADPETGHLLFVVDQNLMAQAFDAKGLRLTGDAFPVATDIQYFRQTHSALFSASDNGVLLYQTRSTAGASQLVWVDRSGKSLGSLGVPGDLANPRISPDGKRVGVDITDPRTGKDDVWIYESSGGLPTRFTSDPALDSQPIWSPDGSRIVFTSYRRGHADLFEKSASGAGSEAAIIVSEETKSPNDWSADGRFILYGSLRSQTNFELWVLPVGGARQPVPFLKSTFGVSHGQFSPDGRWVAYASNESGKWEIHVAPFAAPGSSWKVSSAGGSEPRWRRDGRELYYLAPDGELMAVNVRTGAAFAAEVAKPLFHTRLRQHISAADKFSYDVFPDGQRFLLNTDVGEATSPPLTLLLNWPMGLMK
jgi:eukaryotic-like serine/threonine-protein kinase